MVHRRTTSRLRHVAPKVRARQDDKRAADRLRRLTREWGPSEDVALYLDRCQVDTPTAVVDRVWALVSERRQQVEKVVDFGAGDGRFARRGRFRQYVGYEIDTARCPTSTLPPGAVMFNHCAFSETITDADVCLGNPPFVRNQDLPSGWRARAAEVIRARTGVTVSGLANAWQYFALLSLASTKADGLVALVIPYEWVSRPSAAALRRYIEAQRWAVCVQKLSDETFDRVLTTASITLIDKGDRSGKWTFAIDDHPSESAVLESPVPSKRGVVSYSRRTENKRSSVQVKRGLSPGTQEVLTLTEGERVRAGLRVSDDVVPCVTSLRSLDLDCLALTDAVFRQHFRDAGAKCWLIRTDKVPSLRLRTYLDSIPQGKYQTATCLNRTDWWRFSMPAAPRILVSSSFTGTRPKAVLNRIKAMAIGGVSGIYGVSVPQASRLVDALQTISVATRLVPYSNGLLKLEIGQFNTIVSSLTTRLETGP